MGHRSLGTRDAASTPACRVVVGRTDGRCAARSRSSGASARQQLTTGRAARRGSRRLEFHTTVDWREEHTLLKVCFPLDVHARNATYEMPFGHAERPTHCSTSLDRARYEVPGHRLADLSEHGFGVALLNGLQVRLELFGNELRLSLLRAPKHARPGADVGSPRVRVRARPSCAAAGAKAGSSRKGCASTRRCARRTGRRDVVRVGRRSESRARHDQARRELRRARAPSLRGAWRGGRARMRLGGAVQRAPLANALEEETGAVEVENGRCSSFRTGLTRSSRSSSADGVHDARPPGAAR